MHISIWQQFSSNHSNSFTVVGEFLTPQAAQHAANELQQMLKTIAQWIIDNPEEAARINKDWATKLAPPESAFKNQYRVEWDYSMLDWYFLIVKEQRADDVVSFFDNLVIVDSIGETWSGEHPFDGILSKLGGQVMVDTEHKGTYLRVSITITAPDTETMDEIDEALRDSKRSIPWIIYFGGKLANNPEELLLQAKLAHEWHRSNRRGNAINPYENAFWKSLYTDVMIYPDYDIYERKGNTLYADNVSFYSYAVGFPALIAWLRAKGCEVQYKFELEG